MAYVKMTGKLVIDWHGARLEPKPSKPLYLLLYAAYYQDWVSREKLAFLFWPQSSDKKSQQNLRAIIFRAKEFEYAQGLVVEPERLKWPIKTDIAIFKEAIVAQDWQKAIKSYSGQFLADTRPKEAGLEAWLNQERADLERVWKNAANNYVLQLEQNGNIEAARDLLEQILIAEPLAEDILQRYMKNCYLLNQKTKALEAYKSFKKLLKKELDLEPLEQTIEILNTIKSSKPIASISQVKQKDKAKQDIPLSVLKPPKLIGRQKIIAKLEQSSSKVIFIHAEAGIGKSRLIAEIAPEAIKIKCQDGLENIPFYPIVQLLKKLLNAGIKTPDLKQYNDDLARLVPELMPELSPAPVEPETGKLRLFEALSRYFEYIVQEKNVQGFALVFDDLQWMDHSSLDFLVYLANKASLRFIAAFRTHEKSKYLEQAINSLESSNLLSLIELEPLGIDSLSELMASLMGVQKGPPIFSKWLAKNTAGNPMFVLETLKSLFETGTLSSKNQAWQTNIDEITTNYSEIIIPNAVQEIIKRRIDNLSAETKRVLQVASVISQNFNPEILSKISGLSEWTVLDSFEEAQSKALITNNSFQHDLLRQTIYNDIAKSRKNLIHLKTAQELRGKADISIVAEHYLAAGDIANTLDLWLEYAQQLEDHGFAYEAIEILERALALEISNEKQNTINEKLAENYKSIGKHKISEDLIAKILLAKPNKLIKAKCLLIHAGNLVQFGNINNAQKAILEAQELATDISDEDLKLQLNSSAAMIEDQLGNYDKALEYLEVYKPLIEQEKPAANLFFVINSLAALYSNVDNLAEAEKMHNKALELAKKLNSKYYQVEAVLNMLYGPIELVRSRGVIELAEEVLQFGRYEGSDALQVNLATTYFDLAELAKAEQHYLELTNISTKTNILLVSWAKLAEIYSLNNAGQSLITKALDRALELAKKTEFYIVHAVLIIAVSNFGSKKQKAQLKPYIDNLEMQKLPDYLRLRLLDSLKNN